MAVVTSIDDVAAGEEYLPAIPVSAGALIFDRAGLLLILKPTYKSGWTIPGGVMEADGETPWEACQREVREECGIEVRRARLACMDFRRQKPGRAGGIRFLFDCGRFGDTDLDGIVVQPEEISEYRFSAVPDALDLLRGPIRRRVRAATGSKRLIYLEDGRPVPGVGAPSSRLADYQAERVPGRVAVDAPRYRLPGRARARRDVLSGTRRRRTHPVMGRGRVHQDVNGAGRCPREGRLPEGRALPVGGAWGAPPPGPHPTGVPPGPPPKARHHPPPPPPPPPPPLS